MEEIDKPKEQVSLESLFPINSRCGNVKEKLFFIKVYLASPEKAIQVYGEEKILRCWFHILTCANCNLDIEEEFAKSFPELMLFQEKALWKVVSYLLRRDQGYRKYYSDRYGEEHAQSYASAITEKEVEEIEREHSAVFSFWMQIISRGWKRVFFIRCNNGIRIKDYDAVSLAAGCPKDIPPKVLVDRDFLEGRDLSLQFDTVPGAKDILLSLQGGSADFRALLTVKVIYKDGSYDVWDGSKTIGNQFIIPENKAKNILYAELLYKYLFSIVLESRDYDSLNSRNLPDCIKEKLGLSSEVSIEVQEKDKKWLIMDKSLEKVFSLVQEKKECKIFRES